MLAIGDLQPFERNSRLHGDDQVAQIAASIEKWGWTIPVLIDEDGTIIAGHGRVAAARCLELDEIPCMVARGWSDEMKRAYVIADNKLALNAEWNDDLLAEELRQLQGSFDLGVVGFSDEELLDLLHVPVIGQCDPDAAPPLEENVVTRVGDLWQLGDHRIICGDCTSSEVVSRLLGAERPRLMVTDPPYGVNYDASWREHSGLGGKNVAKGKVLNDDRADWLEAWNLFPGDVAYVWHGALHNVDVARSLHESGFDVRSQIVWVKTRAPISRGHYHWQHEPAFYAVREEDVGAAWSVDHDSLAYLVRAGKTAGWRGGRKQTTVWFIEHLKNDTGHSTQKPVDCMRRPIENNSKPGESVYEPFSGSGTTIIAAEISGRRCFAVELNPAYVDVAIRRWEKFTGREAVLMGGSGGSEAEAAQSGEG